MDPIALARDLVAINSPTGEEGVVGEFLADLLERLGYLVIRQEVTPHRCNVFAYREPPIVVLSTHIDTVPPPLPVREDETWLYGRGTADAKGVAAAQVAAAQTLHHQAEQRIGLLFVVGEEGPSDGARAAARLEPKGHYIINGEPTGNRLAVGGKGSLRLVLEARGRAAHSAYPAAGHSAITTMLDALGRIRDLEFESDPVLGDVTLNVGMLEGGVAANVIPETCRAELMYRTVSADHSIIDDVRSAAGDQVNVPDALEAPPMRLEARSGYETTVVHFGTDLPYLTDWGRPFLVGPGSILVAHTDHERIAKKELEEGAELYLRLARELLAETP